MLLDNPIVKELVNAKASCPNCNPKRTIGFNEFNEPENKFDFFVNENFKLGGLKFQYVTDEEVADMILRYSKADNKGKKKLKLLKPVININNVDMSKGYPNIQALRELLLKQPSSLLSKNAKMSKSKVIMFNIGIPALHGLAVDKETNQFALVNTCPSAGRCKLFCYAMKGMYIFNKHSSKIQSQRLNLLLNDPESFARRLSAEITNEKYKAQAQEKEIVIRWHDSGDFFSHEYLDIGFEIAREHPDVTFTAYTKVASAYKADAPDNFVFTFSIDSAKPAEVQKIDAETSKISVEVPKELFTDLMTPRTQNFIKPEFSDVLKDRLYQKYGDLYNIKRKNIITYDEMLNMKYRANISTENKKAVIITTNDGDDGATRNDVRILFLLVH